MPFYRFIHTQRALIALCAACCLAACSTPCRQWQFQQVAGCSSRFNSGRLILPGESETSRLQLEILRTSSGIRVYLNILFLRALPFPEDPSRTTVEIIFPDQDAYAIYPTMMQGGQRLLLDPEDGERLIQALMEGESFTIQMGRHQTLIIPDHFEKAYTDLMKITIEQIEECQLCEDN